ncbi:MAG: hypothetical protein ACREAC_25530, partial [Blastocatellia bacterium]
MEQLNLKTTAELIQYAIKNSIVDLTRTPSERNVLDNPEEVRDPDSELAIHGDQGGSLQDARLHHKA